MISIETANQIREALGPASITFQSMTAEEIAEEFEAFQVERRSRNTYRDWLTGIIATEQIHLAKEPVANQDELLDQMQRRLFAVKKGDDMKKVKKNTNATTTVKSQAPKAASKKAASKATKPATTKAEKVKAPKSDAPGVEAPAKIETAKVEALVKVETPRAEAPAKADAPKVGDPQLATEADFTSPCHERLSDYRYYAMVDKENKVVGRGFLARIDNAPRRSWFALRNEEQTKLWETSKWAIREIDLERYQQLTLKYLMSEKWPEFKSSRSKAA